MGKIILFGGKSRIGKETAVNFAKQHGYYRVDFFDQVKNIVAELYNLSNLQINGSLQNKIDPYYGMSPKHILKSTYESQKNINQDIWVSYAFEKTIKYYLNEGIKRFCIPDWNYKFEADYALDWAKRTCNEVILVKIDRPNTDSNIVQPNLEDLSNEGHLSEYDLEDFENYDYIIRNDSSIEDFLNKVKTILYT